MFRTVTVFPLPQCPKTVENFTTHAKNGYYDGIIFHRQASCCVGVSPAAARGAGRRRPAHPCACPPCLLKWPCWGFVLTDSSQSIAPLRSVIKGFMLQTGDPLGALPCTFLMSLPRTEQLCLCPPLPTPRACCCCAAARSPQPARRPADTAGLRAARAALLQAMAQVASRSGVASSQTRSAGGAQSSSRACAPVLATEGCRGAIHPRQQA